jgi:hypothetical protein
MEKEILLALNANVKEVNSMVMYLQGELANASIVRAQE